MIYGEIVLELLGADVKRLVLAVLACLAISGCGYWWAAAYETDPSLSYWGITKRSQSDFIKDRVAEFANRNQFRQTTTIHSQLDSRGRIFSGYLTKRNVRASITNVPRGCILNVGFYNARVGGIHKKELDRLGAEFTILMNELDITLHDRPMSVEDEFPRCEDD